MENTTNTFQNGNSEIILHADGRVELLDYSTINTSPLYNEDLAPVKEAEVRDWLNDFRLQ
ncbi:MAG: hypothetical protein ABI977_01210 [Acidobacteriota bacterium]